jgi:hypothetical protein
MGQCVGVALELQNHTNVTQAFFTTDGLQYNSSILAASSRGKNSKGSKITGMKSSGWPGPSWDVPHSSTVPTSSDGHDRLLVSTNDSRNRLYNLWDNSLEAKYRRVRRCCCGSC